MQTEKLSEGLEQWIAKHNVLGAIEVEDVRALLSEYTLCSEEPVAWRYTLEYGNTTAHSMVFPDRRRYPFGVCGADYLARNDDGVSYIRETPLHTPADIGKGG